MPKLILTAVGAFAAAVLAVAAVSTAGAQPQEPEIVDLDCGADGQYTVVVKGAGLWTPGHILGGGVIIPTAFEFHATVTVNAVVVDEFSETIAKPHPRNQPQIVCTFGETFEEDGAVINFEGTVTGFIPRGHR